MAADAVVTCELQSLQDELSTAQRERTAATAPPPLARPDPPLRRSSWFRPPCRSSKHCALEKKEHELSLR